MAIMLTATWQAACSVSPSLPPAARENRARRHTRLGQVHWSRAQALRVQDHEGWTAVLFTALEELGHAIRLFEADRQQAQRTGQAARPADHMAYYTRALIRALLDDLDGARADLHEVRALVGPGHRYAVIAENDLARLGGQ